MQPVVSVSHLSKTFASGFEALKDINLEIRPGEIFALLGPNGAGKTTLISVICGIVNPTKGEVLAGGHDIITEYRAARSLIGLVPQELTTDAFETVRATVAFSRGLFGKKEINMSRFLVVEVLKMDGPTMTGRILDENLCWSRATSLYLSYQGRRKGARSVFVTGDDPSDEHAEAADAVDDLSGWLFGEEKRGAAGERDAFFWGEDEGEPPAKIEEPGWWPRW